LAAIGVAAVAAIRRFVLGDFYRSTVPNSQTTIDAKKSDKPLIDTGQLVNSITYVIDDKPAPSRYKIQQEKKNPAQGSDIY
jgi:hypothetical protein